MQSSAQTRGARGGRGRGGGGSRGSGHRGGGGRGGGAAPTSTTHSRASSNTPAAPVAVPAAIAGVESAVSVGLIEDDDEGEFDPLTTCFLCTNQVQYFAVGECSHRTCHTCAVRLRALHIFSLFEVCISAEASDEATVYLIRIVYSRTVIGRVAAIDPIALEVKR